MSNSIPFVPVMVKDLREVADIPIGGYLPIDLGDGIMQKISPSLIGSGGLGSATPTTLPDTPIKQGNYYMVSNTKLVPVPVDNGSNDDTYIHFLDNTGSAIIVKAQTNGQLLYNGTSWAYVQNAFISKVDNISNPNSTDVVTSKGVSDAVATPYTNDFFETI